MLRQQYDDPWKCSRGAYTRKANVDILQALGLLQTNENWAKESLHDS